MRIVLLFLVLVSTAIAQTRPAQPAGTPGATPTPAPTPQPAVDSRRPIWRCNLSGGTYQVVVGAMLSVSSHEYVVDGAARVTEVNVDTTGQLAVRFYFIEPAVVAGPGGIHRGLHRGDVPGNPDRRWRPSLGRAGGRVSSRVRS